MTWTVFIKVLSSFCIWLEKELYIISSGIDEIISEEHNKNFKSILLEYSQGRSLGIPKYKVKKEEGPDHDKLFTIEVMINNQVLGMGKGNSKKKAEMIAAKNALKKLNVDWS